jgi:hypothetical protein
MFFHISKTVQPNFPHNHRTNHFVVNLDEGWTNVQDQHGNDIWYKGYLDDAPLQWHAVRISDESTPTHNGNFCVIKVTDSGLTIRTDKLRSFPIWHDLNDGLTNLRSMNTTVWADSVIDVANDLSLSQTSFDAIGNINDSVLTKEQAVDQIDTLLDNKIKTFLDNLSDPLKVFLSGGWDTGLIFSYIKKHTNNYELVRSLHRECDYFYLKNHGDLKKFWAYQHQIHSWKEPCILVSGAPGDEFTARGPLTANLLLLPHGLSIPTLLKDPKFKNGYMYSYYNQEKFIDMWNKQEQEYNKNKLSIGDTIKTACNYNLNDWQHWHLGNTLTWTPLRDIEMFKLFARLEPTALIDQVMNGGIQKELINRNDSALMHYMAPYKTTTNYMSSLTEYYSTL